MPVLDTEQGHILGQIGAILAQANQGELLALHVQRVPQQLTLGEGRLFLKEGRGYLDIVIQEAKKREVPVHSIIRLGRHVADAIRQTAIENASDLILLGWHGDTSTVERFFGQVIDPLVSDPPTDLALVRHRVYRLLKSILVPVAGGPNNRLAVKLAVQMARLGETTVKVVLLHVVAPSATTADHVRAAQVFRDDLEGLEYSHLEKRVVEGTHIAETILEQAKESQLIVIGATEEPILRNLMMGNIAEQVARKAPMTVIMVKRRTSPLHSFLRQTVLEPARKTELVGEVTDVV
ncbi:MAG: universal stress protein [Chloroflexi bacterium]|nr:universal stress protein [Chloroflexota bacterium]